MKSTCLAFGEAFAGTVVVPQLHAAAGIPAWPAAAPPACPLTSHGPSPEGQAEGSQLHARLARRGLLGGPASPPQQVAGVAAALPLLLAGALPYAGASAAAACLRRLCTDGGSGSGEVWALQHPRAFVPAVRCAAEAHLVQVRRAWLSRTRSAVVGCPLCRRSALHRLPPLEPALPPARAPWPLHGPCLHQIRV